MKGPIKKHISYRKIILTVIFAQVSLIALIITALMTTYLPPSDPEMKDVLVPSLTGTVYCPDDAALPPDLYEVTVEYRSDADQAPGTVLEQAPPPGAHRRVLPGKSPCHLRLTVSTGETLVTVPELLDTDVREAKLSLRALGLAVALCEAERSDLSPGRVILVDPPAGTKLHPGESVTLTASVLPTVRTVKVPDVVGMMSTYANSALVLRGLCPTDPTFEASDRPAGTVLSQRSLPDTIVPAGTPAQLWISEGPRQTPLFPFSVEK